MRDHFLISIIKQNHLSVFSSVLSIAMSTSAFKFSYNRSSSSQDREQSTGDDRVENGNVRTEILRDVSESNDQCDQSDHSEVPTDRRNLIAFFCFGVCNVFLLFIGINSQPFFKYHSAMFFASVPLGVIKISPMFISNFMK